MGDGILAIKAISSHHLGNQQEVSDILETLEDKSKDNAGGSPSLYMAMIHTELGNADLALEYLENAYNNKEVEMYWLKMEPPFKPLYNDPR